MKRFNTTCRLASSSSLALMLLVARAAQAQVGASPPAQGAVTSQLPSLENHHRVAPLSWARHPSPARQPASTR